MKEEHYITTFEFTYIYVFEILGKMKYKSKYIIHSNSPFTPKSGIDIIEFHLLTSRHFCLELLGARSS